MSGQPIPLRMVSPRHSSFRGGSGHRIHEIELPPAYRRRQRPPPTTPPPLRGSGAVPPHPDWVRDWRPRPAIPSPIIHCGLDRPVGSACRASSPSHRDAKARTPVEGSNPSPDRGEGGPPEGRWVGDAATHCRFGANRFRQCRSTGRRAMTQQPGWHAVALAGGVETATSMGTRLFGEEIVVWRDATGAAHAWEDRCPHRGMRLSMGFVRTRPDRLPLPRLAIRHRRTLPLHPGPSRHRGAADHRHLAPHLRRGPRPALGPLRRGGRPPGDPRRARRPRHPAGPQPVHRPAGRTRRRPLCSSPTTALLVDKRRAAGEPPARREGPLLIHALPGNDLLIAAVHPMDADRAALHLVIAGATEKYRGAGQLHFTRFAEALRDSIELGMPMPAARAGSGLCMSGAVHRSHSPLPSGKGDRVWEYPPPRPLWERAFGLGIAGSEATEMPRPEGRGVPRRALADRCLKQAHAGEPAADYDNTPACIGNVWHRSPAWYPSPSFSRLGFASPREGALPHKGGGGESCPMRLPCPSGEGLALQVRSARPRAPLCALPTDATRIITHAHSA